VQPAPQQSRRERRRRQILDAARDLFAERGYLTTTIDDIVGRVQVARGTFYLYFEDKKDIFGALLGDFFEAIAGRIESIELGDATRSPRQQLRQNLERVVQLALSHPSMVRIALHHASGIDPDLDERLSAFYRALRQFMDESLLEGQSMGLVRSGDRGIMVSFALGALKEILLDAVMETQDRGADAGGTERIVSAMMEFLDHGLLAEPGPAALGPPALGPAEPGPAEPGPAELRAADPAPAGR